jgi:hypothetical protein
MENIENIEKIKWEIIPPEIKHDEFYNLIIKLFEIDKNIKTILEIGASSGDGSTEAFMIAKKGTNAKLYSIEVCTERFDILKGRYNKDTNFHTYNVSSISLEQFPSKQKITHFYNNTQTYLNRYPLEQVLEWYDNDIKYVSRNNIPEDGINLIKKNHNITIFDCVLIDGSEFTGNVELDLVYGAKYIMLDDIFTFKNYEANQRLKNDKKYICLIENYKTRHGFSIYMLKPEGKAES